VTLRGKEKTRQLLTSFHKDDTSTQLITSVALFRWNLPQAGVTVPGGPKSWDAVLAVTVGRAQPGFIVPGGDSPGAFHVKGSSQGEEFVRLSEKPKGAERRRRPTPPGAQGRRYIGTLAGLLPAVSQTITGVFTSAMSAAMILMQ